MRVILYNHITVAIVADLIA